MSGDADAHHVVLKRLLLKLVFAAIIAVVMGPYLKAAVSSVLNRSGTTASAPPSRSVPVQLPVPHVGAGNAIPAVAPIEPTSPTIDDRPADAPTYRQPTGAEIRESQRKADEAMRILEASTPEM